MKAATTALQTFLATTQNFWMCDLYQFTLNGGQVLYYSSAGVIITYGGNTYQSGPRWAPQGIKQQLGVQTDQLEVDLYADGRHTVNGIPLLTFIKNKGFDQALVLITRVFAPSYGATIVGGAIRFSGRMSELQDAGQTSCKLIIASGLEVLDVNMPADTYQSSCLNTLYDTNCTLSKASFQATSTVSAGATPTPTSLNMNIAPASNTYTLGALVFTSGANSGVRRSIKTQTAGAVTFSAPFPYTPAVGDAFTIYRGCNLSMATCSGVFNNLVHFRGQPFIPTPSTILGSSGAPVVSSTAGIQVGGVVGIGGIGSGAGEQLMQEVEWREAVVSEALTWARTPYHHRAAVKGVGADCALFPIAVYKSVGAIPDEFDPGSYPFDWATHRDEERYLGFLSKLTREIERERLQAGDFIVWKFGRSFSHGGIMISDKLVIHAYIDAGCVTIDDITIEGQLSTRAQKCFTLWER